MNNSNKNSRLWAQTYNACRELRLAAAISGTIFAMTLAACSDTGKWNGSLEALLGSQPERFATVLKDAEKYRVQVLYTQIDRDADNRPTFVSFNYRLDADEYFYPASTVKLPAAALALEKLNALGVQGLDRDTPMLTGSEYPGQTDVREDPSSPSGLPSLAHYVQKILLVSDNDAYNRLYEFLSQETLNERLRAMGFAGTRIMHRLEIALSVEANRHTNPVRFVDGDAILYAQEPAYSSRDYSADTPILLGEAEMVGGERLERPKDFAVKNAYPLQAQHDVVKSIMFPDDTDASMRFELSEDDYRFLYQNMSGYPGDSGIFDYTDAEQYPDGYVKFLMFGGDAPTIPANIRVYNKPGDAYGFLTDVAYIVDLDNGIEFLLAATIYTNANQTFNDDNYEYDEVAMPFLRELGNAIYEIELKRDKEHAPNFDRLGLGKD